MNIIKVILDSMKLTGEDPEYFAKYKIEAIQRYLEKEHQSNPHLVCQNLKFWIWLWCG